MNALVFAAGLGTRLKPFTESHPKALVPLCGEPMLKHVLLKLKASGVERVVVNVHHFAGQVVDFLLENDNFGLDITVSDESALLLETGAGLAQAARIIGSTDEPLLVHNADIYTDFDLRAMGDDFIASDADTALLVAGRTSSRQLLFDSSMRMYGWENLKTGEVRPSGTDTSALSPFAFGGVHILGTKAQEALLRYDLEKRTTPAGPPTPFGIMEFYIAGCRSLDIRGYIPRKDYRWFDIGSPEKLQNAEAILKNEKHTM